MEENKEERTTFYNMKRLGFRAAFLSTDKNVGARTKGSQTTEPQLFYIVCCRAFIFLSHVNILIIQVCDVLYVIQI